MNGMKYKIYQYNNGTDKQKFIVIKNQVLYYVDCS